MLPFTDATLVDTARVLTNEHPSAVPVEVRSLTPDGALIIAMQPLAGPRVLMMLETADFGMCLIEADVVHHSEYYQTRLGMGEVEYSACRLRFRRRIPVGTMHPTLQAAFGTAPEETSEVPADEEEAPEESLVPLLSAIGIVVVYASQMPWHQIL